MNRSGRMMICELGIAEAPEPASAETPRSVLSVRRVSERKTR